MHEVDLEKLNYVRLEEIKELNPQLHKKIISFCSNLDKEDFPEAVRIVKGKSKSISSLIILCKKLSKKSTKEKKARKKLKEAEEVVKAITATMLGHTQVQTSRSRSPQRKKKQPTLSEDKMGESSRSIDEKIKALIKTAEEAEKKAKKIEAKAIAEEKRDKENTTLFLDAAQLYQEAADNVVAVQHIAGDMFGPTGLNSKELYKKALDCYLIPEIKPQKIENTDTEGDIKTRIIRESVEDIERGSFRSLKLYSKQPVGISLAIANCARKSGNHVTEAILLARVGLHYLFSIWGYSTIDVTEYNEENRKKAEYYLRAAIKPASQAEKSDEVLTYLAKKYFETGWQLRELPESGLGTIKEELGRNYLDAVEKRTGEIFRAQKIYKNPLHALLDWNKMDRPVYLNRIIEKAEESWVPVSGDIVDKMKSRILAGARRIIEEATDNPIAANLVPAAEACLFVASNRKLLGVEPDEASKKAMLGAVLMFYFGQTQLSFDLFGIALLERYNEIAARNETQKGTPVPLEQTIEELYSDYNTSGLTGLRYAPHKLDFNELAKVNPYCATLFRLKLLEDSGFPEIENFRKEAEKLKGEGTSEAYGELDLRIRTSFDKWLAHDNEVILHQEIGPYIKAIRLMAGILPPEKRPDGAINEEDISIETGPNPIVKQALQLGIGNEIDGTTDATGKININDERINREERLTLVLHERIHAERLINGEPGFVFLGEKMGRIKWLDEGFVEYLTIQQIPAGRTYSGYKTEIEFVTRLSRAINDDAIVARAGITGDLDELAENLKTRLGMDVIGGVIRMNNAAEALAYLDQMGVR